MTSVATAAAVMMSASMVMPAAVAPAVAAVVAMARATIVAEAKIQFDRWTGVGRVAASVIGVVAGVRRSIHRTSAESRSQQQSGCASFQYIHASSNHMSPLTVDPGSV